MILTVTLNASIDKLYRVKGFELHKVTRVSEVSNTAGGKGLNVSRVAALAGSRVIAMGFVGGHNGALLESLLTTEGIEKAFTHVAAETRCCINASDEFGKSTELLEPGSPVTEAEKENFLKDYSAMLPRADVVAISGSMPKGLPKDFYGTLVKMAKEAGKPVLLDSSGDAMLNALSAGPDFIKPNTDEIKQITGQDIESEEDLIEAAKKLHESGIRTVAISRGGDGVLVVTDSGVYRGRPPEVQVVNVVGCGDSMVAGFAVKIAEKAPIEEQIAFASAVATSNALTDKTGSFEQKDLERILPLVKVEKIQ